MCVCVSVCVCVCVHIVTVYDLSPSLLVVASERCLFLRFGVPLARKVKPIIFYYHEICHKSSFHSMQESHFLPDYFSVFQWL